MIVSIAEDEYYATFACLSASLSRWILPTTKPVLLRDQPIGNRCRNCPMPPDLGCEGMVIALGMDALAVTTLNLVFEHARDFDMIDRNSAKGVRRPEGRKEMPRRKWTDDDIASMYDHGNPFARRAMMVLLYTRLRSSDAVRLTHRSIVSGMIEIRTQKTDTPVSISVHAKLRAELARPLPFESLRLITGKRGGETGVQAVRHMLKQEFQTPGIENGPTTHGLRKNAVACLVEAGCMPRVIQAITDQPLRLIEHDVREYERRGLVKVAIIKWEEHQENE